jgi:hypothetical protein
MDNTIIVALITSGSSVLIAVTALLLNYRGFAAIDGRFSSIDARFSSIERRLDMMQSNMKDLNKTMTALEIDVALVKDKLKM